MVDKNVDGVVFGIALQYAHYVLICKFQSSFQVNRFYEIF